MPRCASDRRNEQNNAEVDDRRSAEGANLKHAARGFGFSHEPTTFIEYPVTAADIMAFAFLIALGTLYFMLYWTGLGGIGPMK